MSSLHEECGVFGIYSNKTHDIGPMAYYGLFALQHRDLAGAVDMADDEMAAELVPHLELEAGLAWDAIHAHHALVAELPGPPEEGHIVHPHASGALQQRLQRLRVAVDAGPGVGTAAALADALPLHALGAPQERFLHAVRQARYHAPHDPQVHKLVLALLFARRQALPADLDDWVRSLRANPVTNRNGWIDRIARDAGVR